jgi:hypothetical protein
MNGFQLINYDIGTTTSHINPLIEVRKMFLLGHTRSLMNTHNVDSNELKT